MEENKQTVQDSTIKKTSQLLPENELEVSDLQLNFQTISAMVILNFKWFVLSLIIFMGAASIYLRYARPQFQAVAKMLIKDDENKRYKSKSLENMSNLGIISNSNGIDNEVEILSSRAIAEETVRDLKLHISYFHKGKVTNAILYKVQPITVDIDDAHADELDFPISMRIHRTDDGKYHVTGSYSRKRKVDNEILSYQIDKTFTQMPARINTSVGILTFSVNPKSYDHQMHRDELVTIVSPATAAYKYTNNLTVEPTSKYTSIAQLVLKDESADRAVDYLTNLAISYNRQANEDKNEIAVRTEEFINGRLEKINAELGDTEGKLENYKKSNRMVELKTNAVSAIQNSDAYNKQLNEANTQVELLNSLQDYMNDPANKYQTLPSNVGLTDASATSLINKYNEIVLERNRLLRSASETSPTVTPLTAQLNDLNSSIRGAMNQARRNAQIQRFNIERQYQKYQGQISETPEQERMLTQIGRQQEVKSGLYLMLLQKREENSISLAATADKGRLIDRPAFAGKVSPKNNIIMLVAFILGLVCPIVILFIGEKFRYRIEGHNDVMKLTRLPILADIAVASDTAKTKADIVVHENKNNHMEEVFRSLRTNIQFVLEEKQKVVMLTSSTSGEGKTFVAANLAVSFALLGKKVVLVGLDIRKPRLAELFEIDNHHNGITNLLVHRNPDEEMLRREVLASGVNRNLELLLAGPIPPNPAELIARPSLEKVFAMLREQYDYVIIDTAPIGLVTDTLMVGRVADTTIYVCRADYTAKETFAMINGLAEDDKLPKMAIVINGIDMSKKKYGYYYGYGRYGKYSRYSYGSYKYGYGGKYGYGYGKYGQYGQYGQYGLYGSYGENKYLDKNDDSIKR